VGILEGKFKTFNDYLLSLPPVKRKAVKQDMRKFKKSGFVLEAVNDPLPIAEKIHELTMNVFHRHNFMPTDFNKRSLASSFRFMQEYMQTFVIRKSGKIISTHTIVEKNGIIESHALGLDYKELGDSRSYFYVFFYNTIMEMIKRKANYINFFQMAYKTKERRGCRLIKQYMLVKSLKANSFLDRWLAFAHRRYAHKFESDYRTGR
jgi:predicted N-acyltransferase